MKPRTISVVAIALMSGLLAGTPAHAVQLSASGSKKQIFTVRNLLDSGPGSLRQAILDANANPGADRIHFTGQARGTIALTSGQLDITDDVQIRGPGAEQLVVSGNGQSRVFQIHSSVSAEIERLTITNGRAVGTPGSGGGILNDGSTLVLADVVLSNNQALGASGGTGRGGAVANLAGATLIVTDSLFTQNQAVGGTGGQGNGGASRARAIAPHRAPEEQARRRPQGHRRELEQPRQRQSRDAGDDAADTARLARRVDQRRQSVHEEAQHRHVG